MRNLLIETKKEVIRQSRFNRDDEKQQLQYAFLSRFIGQFSGKKIMDAGTFMGLSAHAMSSNGRNTIHTYDISDDHVRSDFIAPSNIFFHQQDVNTLSDEEIHSFDIIYLDIDPHDGIQEKVFTDRLHSIKWKGILIADDIYLNDGMKNWWFSLPYVKIDLTHVGQHSGTGLISMTDEYQFILR